MTQALGEPFDTGIASLDRLGLTAYRVAEAGAVHDPLGRSAPAGGGAGVAGAGSGGGNAATGAGKRSAGHAGALTRIPGVGARSATAIVMRALHWPDAFWAADPELQRAAGVTEYGGAAPNG